MKITKLNIEIRAVKAYETFAIGAEIEADEQIDIAELKEIESTLMTEAIEGVNNLCARMGVESKEEPKVERKSNFRAVQQNNYVPANQPQAYNRENPAPRIQYNNVWYKLCQNKSTGERFYALEDLNLQQSGFARYVQINEAYNA